MKKRQKKDDRPENVERWMVSYADFVTLLFCFFTAMYAISNVDSNKLGKFVESMRFAFNDDGGQARTYSVIEGVQVINNADAAITAHITESLGRVIEDATGSINVKQDTRGVVISVADKYFYETGAADLKENARGALDKIASALIQYPHMIRIEGHTDNIPIHSSTFPSNWELSAVRAINVARYFIDTRHVPPERISTIGYAAYKPLASNDTPEGRAKNRRVDIVLLSDNESRKEPR